MTPNERTNTVTDDRHPLKCSHPGCNYLGMWSEATGHRCPLHRQASDAS